MAHEFAVWAPDRTSVGLVLDGRTEAMTASADGWWSITVDDAGPGTDYAFSLDGGDPLPDPRSRWQPHGVHGASRVVAGGSERCRPSMLPRPEEQPLEPC